METQSDHLDRSTRCLSASLEVKRMETLLQFLLSQFISQLSASLEVKRMETFAAREQDQEQEQLSASLEVKRMETIELGVLDERPVSLGFFESQTYGNDRAPSKETRSL